MSESNDPYATREPDVRRKNTAGRVSLVLGILIVLIQLAQTIYVQLIPYLQSTLDLSLANVAALLIPFQVVIGLLAVVAIILGIVGLTRRGVPKGAAGAGTALGAAALFLLAAGLLAQLIYRIAL